MNTKYIIRIARRFLVVMMIVLSTAVTVNAQGDGFDDPPLDTPIDGGLSLLIAAGVGYGVKKVRDARKKNEK